MILTRSLLWSCWFICMTPEGDRHAEAERVPVPVPVPIVRVRRDPEEDRPVVYDDGFWPGRLTSQARQVGRRGRRAPGGQGGRLQLDDRRSAN